MVLFVYINNNYNIKVSEKDRKKVTSSTVYLTDFHQKCDKSTNLSELGKADTWIPYESLNTHL